MLSRRFPLHGLFAVLLALMAQLGVGATVPRLDPFLQIAGAQVLCHSDDPAGTPPVGPAHSSDCLVCPLCIAMHASQPGLIAAAADIAPPSFTVARRAELPPPSTAPPSPQRPPAQPRAPPIVS